MAAIRAVTRIATSHHHPRIHKKGIKSPSKKIPRHIVTKSVANLQHAEEPHRLINAVRQNDQRSIREIFEEAIELNGDINKLATVCFQSLKESACPKKQLEKFVDAYIQAKVEKALKLQDHKELKVGLQENYSENFPEIFPKNFQREEIAETLIFDALNQIKTPIASRVRSDMQALRSVPFEKHQLTSIDALAICIFAENELEKRKETDKNSYHRPKDACLSRALFIEPKRKTFTILSKKFGELQAEGAFKRVTDAIEIAHVENKSEARHLVRLVNKAEEVISSRELDYEKLYGKVISWYRYKSKKRTYEEKIFLLQEAYDHDLYIFTEYTSSKLRKKIDLLDLLNVLLEIGKTIETMHNDGVVHHDVKCKNVLFRKNKKREVEAKLIDFGHTYRPGDLRAHLKKRKKGYGTLRYTAPDVLEDPFRQDNMLMLAKAEDMFALGCLLYEVYIQEKTPWAEKVYACLKQEDSELKLRKRAIEVQKETQSKLRHRAKQEKREIDRDIMQLMAKLLEPNPEARINISDFLSLTQEIKTRHQSKI